MKHSLDENNPASYATSTVGEHYRPPLLPSQKKTQLLSEHQNWLLYKDMYWCLLFFAIFYISSKLRFDNFKLNEDDDSQIDS